MNDHERDERDERDRPDRGDPVEMPIDGVLDLHQFRPRDAAELVRDYLDACVARGLRDVRIVHGKGIGNLRRIVHAALARHPAVESFGLAADASGWGATVARLRAGDTEHGPEEPSRGP